MAAKEGMLLGFAESVQSIHQYIYHLLFENQKEDYTWPLYGENAEIFCTKKLS